MKYLLPPSIAFAFLGCAGLAPEASQGTPPRPFKEICAHLQEYPELLRKSFIQDLANGLMCEADAEFSRRDIFSHRVYPPIPNWVDLVRELLLRSQRDLLVELMKDRALAEPHYRELAEILVKRKDPELFAILMSHSEPIERVPEDIRDTRGMYQRPAIAVLAHYLGGVPEEAAAVERLIGVLKGTYWATARGWAAISLGFSDRPEAVEALLRALKDNGSVGSANGLPEETVATCAERSLKQIEKRTGRPIPRVVP
jgi:hypothetical protein